MTWTNILKDQLEVLLYILTLDKQQVKEFFIPLLSLPADLRDDKQFFVDHPGAVPITSAQVRTS